MPEPKPEPRNLASNSPIEVSHQQVGHTTKGTDWGQGAAVYAAVHHGPDGAQFLDPYFLPALLRNIEGKSVIDIGCGAGPWSVMVARYGAERVEAIDIQEQFVALARKAVADAGLEERINVCVGDAAKLAYPDNSFDRAMSINVGCNLPEGSFGAHFREMFRVLKPGGTAIVTAPANFNIVFTNGAVPSDQIAHDIQLAIGAIGFTTDSPTVISHLNGLADVYRATFVETSGTVDLFVSDNRLDPGAPIWRKIPGQAVPNRYHHESEYENVARATGFAIESSIRASFPNNAARDDYNTRLGAQPLGPEYVGANPFLVLVLEKPGEAI